MIFLVIKIISGVFAAIAIILAVISLILLRKAEKAALKSKEALIKDMSENQPLPMGMEAFETWSDRIIAASCMTADHMSLKFALAEMIMHLKPTEDHCPDSYFIKSLRKSAANQIAHAKMTQIRDQAKARLAAQEEVANKNSPKLALVNDAQILANPNLPKS